MKKSLIRLTALALLSWLTIAPAAYADTATTTFSVTAHVPTSCTLTSASTMAFGDYTGALIQTTSTITVTCTSGGAFTIALSDGNNPVAAGGQRRMLHGTSDYLNYELYSDSGRSTRWGAAVSFTGTGASQGLTVYGQLPAGQTPLIAGDYTDTITVTLEWEP